MTNAIVKRLVQKGWLTIRKVNNRNIRYAVSSAGVDQITRRSYRYLKRTIKNIVYYREAIEGFVGDVKAHGYGGIILVGRSDLNFIVEHACRAIGIEYVEDERPAEETGGRGSTLFLLYAESYVPDEEEKGMRPEAAFLQDVVTRMEMDDGAARVR